MINARYVLSLSGYSYADKARILYNHIYFSELPAAYREEILRADFFLEIIKHPHFNPRLVEWLSSFARMQAIPPDGYQRFITRLLTAPHELWNHAFSRQLSAPAQEVLMALYSLGESADVADLEPVWVALHFYRSLKYNRERTTNGIRSVLRELDNAFLSYSRGRVSFINPSIREFVASSISREKSTIEDLLESAVRFNQAVNLYKLAESDPKSELWKFLHQNMARFAWYLGRLLDGPIMRWESGATGMRGHQIDMTLGRKIEFILGVSRTGSSTEMTSLAATCCSRFAERMKVEVNFSEAILVLGTIKRNDDFLKAYGLAPYREILDQMLLMLDRADAYDWLNLYGFLPGCLDWTQEREDRVNGSWAGYYAQGLDSDIDNCGSLEDYEYLVDTLTKLSAYGPDLNDAISSLEETIVDMRAEEGGPEEERDFHPSPGLVVGRHFNDEDARQMFRTIVD